MPSRIEFEVKEGDLAQQPVEAIIVPANEELKLGGGVQGVIARAAGEEPFKQAREIAKRYPHQVVPFESAWVTSPGRLSARGVKGIIHSVAMTTNRPLEPHVSANVIVNRGVISRSVQSVLEVANKSGYETLALPALGTGLWELPISESTLGTLDAVNRTNQSTLKRVVLVLWGTEAYQKALSAASGYSSKTTDNVRPSPIGKLERIGIDMREETMGPNIDEQKPSSLSRAGDTFWRFMYDAVRANGRYTRSQFIYDMREDLGNNAIPAHNKQMELDHEYIQWLFPLSTEGVNPNAPLTQPNDHRALSQKENFKARMYEHFLLFVEFMGIRYNPLDGTFQKMNGQQWANWINYPHNNLRITRILISLKNFGLLQVAQDFLSFLTSEAAVSTPQVIQGQSFIPFTRTTQNSCMNFWMTALD